MLWRPILGRLLSYDKRIPSQPCGLFQRMKLLQQTREHHAEDHHVELADYSARRNQSYSLNPGVRLVSVKVWETASSWAQYQP